jgi:2-amino-4-hydroxy-6-hydroxymethyldihydropteridine diphosphokinase
MSRALLALGANIGERRRQLEDAVRRLDEHPDIHLIRRSAIIETKPVGKTDQPDFLNMVIAVETSLAPVDLMHTCLMIEKAMGRERTERWGPRLIDIDIVAHGRKRVATDALTLPHPRAHERAFVMEPLREIDPETADWVEEVARNDDAGKAAI